MDALAGPGVYREQNRQIETCEVLEELAELAGIIDVLGAVDRRQHEGSGLQPKAAQQHRPHVGRRNQPGGHVNHGVPGDNDTFSWDAFFEKVLPGLLGRREAYIREMIDDHPIVLLRHPAVEAAEPGLDVEQRDVEGIGRHRPAECRVRIALDDHGRRPLRRESLFEAKNQVPDLLPSPSTSDSQHHIRRGEAQLIEEDVG